MGPFVEAGRQRLICVDDAHGSPEQQCPRWIAGYCRGRNLRFTHSCWCAHKERPTEKARYKLVPARLLGRQFGVHRLSPLPVPPEVPDHIRGLSLLSFVSVDVSNANRPLRGPVELSCSFPLGGHRVTDGSQTSTHV